MKHYNYHHHDTRRLRI